MIRILDMFVSIGVLRPRNVATVNMVHDPSLRLRTAHAALVATTLARKESTT